jgi:hypothetical protein
LKNNELVVKVKKILNIKVNPKTDSTAARTRITKPKTWPTTVFRGNKNREDFVTMARVAHSNKTKSLNMEL